MSDAGTARPSPRNAEEPASEPNRPDVPDVVAAPGGDGAGTAAAPKDAEVATAAGVRQWCATAFVVWRGRLLLHHHAKLGMWLPCGGHVEPSELPDDAAVREVMEESGVAVRLVGEPAIDAPGPRHLVRPRGIQLEPIAPGHEHIDLIYFARPEEPYDGAIPLQAQDPSLGWYDAEALRTMDLSAEVRAWCELALLEHGTSSGPAR